MLEAAATVDGGLLCRYQNDRMAASQATTHAGGKQLLVTHAGGLKLACRKRPVLMMWRPLAVPNWRDARPESGITVASSEVEGSGGKGGVRSTPRWQGRATLRHGHGHRLDSRKASTTSAAGPRTSPLTGGVDSNGGLRAAGAAGARPVGAVPAGQAGEAAAGNGR